MTNSLPVNAPNWYEIENISTLDSPALVFYQERILNNLTLLKESISDVSRLRPHVKTHKSAPVTALMLSAGITKFKCATIAEAEMLGSCLAPDVLLAYQPVGPKKDRFIELIHTYPTTRFSCLLDHELPGRELSAAAQAAGIIIPVWMDLNVGMNRTGVSAGEAALKLYLQILSLPGLQLAGIHAYDGHIHEASLRQRKEKWFAVMALILDLKAKIGAMNLVEPLVIAGGTPTYPFYAATEGIECSPGTFILWDKGYRDAFQEQPYLTAGLVITRVISLTRDHLVTVDLGHKSIAAENELGRRVHFLNAPEARFVSQSEEHLVLDLGKEHGLSIGEVLYGLPVHICPTVALYERAYIVQNHFLQKEWMISSRNKKIKI